MRITSMSPRTRARSFASAGRRRGTRTGCGVTTMSWAGALDFVVTTYNAFTPACSRQVENLVTTTSSSAKLASEKRSAQRRGQRGKTQRKRKRGARARAAGGAARSERQAATAQQRNRGLGLAQAQERASAYQCTPASSHTHKTRERSKAAARETWASPRPGGGESGARL